MTPLHYHCVHGCEHPQAFAYGWWRVCGSCFFRFGVLTPVVLCGPGVCDDD